MVVQVLVDGWGRSVTESEQKEWFQRLKFIRFQVRRACIRRAVCGPLFCSFRMAGA